MALEGLQFLDGFKEDIHTLVQPAQQLVVNLLVDVKRGEVAAEPLEDLAATGDLSDCFKLYFDHDPAFQDRPNMRFRLVYRLLPDGEVQGIIVEAVAVGASAQSGGLHTGR